MSKLKMAGLVILGAVAGIGATGVAMKVLNYNIVKNDEIEDDMATVTVKVEDMENDEAKIEVTVENTETISEERENQTENK